MSTGASVRRKRRVTFQNVYTPAVVPPRQVESYDDLVFQVAGLFHTTSFLHDVDAAWGDDADDDDELTTSRSSGDDGPGGRDDAFDPTLERSVPLMIAEFLYRSAMYLGHPRGDRPWLPGFRQDKRFSGNDVKRWRRLAHFDWDAEERAFRRHHVRADARGAHGPSRTLSVESNGHTSMLSTLGASFHGRRRSSCSRSALADGEADARGPEASHGRKKDMLTLRSTVSSWIRKHRRPLFGHEDKEDKTTGLLSSSSSSSSCLPTIGATTTAAAAADVLERDAETDDGKGKKKRKRKPVSWLHPPPVSSSRDLRLVVDIINSCVYCGEFRFRKRDIVRLCNVRI
ncbi:unnamed protein product [Hyaloperonospora brassicae]|uniref:Uncharacterized protein n=1 Tax=Hyaloperonospora brassicae TaxID=162125 RepID=A0AAV0THW5_HYABA|nr:unnamed protein product [Hyaloperonospora brassicae]